MNSASLSVDQLRRIVVGVKRHLNYLDKLTGRMHQMHFPINDPLWVTGENARAAMTQLKVEVERLERAAIRRDEIDASPTVTSTTRR